MSNYPNFNFLHFLDPAPTLTDLSARMTDYEFEHRELVIMGTKRIVNGNPMHRVGERIGLSLTNGRALTTSGTNGWYIDREGQHVIGQLSFIPGKAQGEERLIAVLEDNETWVLGDVWRSHALGGDGSHNGWTLNTFGASDGLQAPHSLTGTSRSRLMVKRAFRPAPWSSDLFPRFNDSPEVVELKLQLAERNWNMRRAQYALHVQAEYRNWTEMLPELSEAGFALPAARRGFIVQGEAMVSVRPPAEVASALRQADPLTLEADRMAQFRTRGGTPGTQLETFARMGFVFPISGRAAEAEVTHNAITYAFADKFGEEPVSLNNVRQSRFINGLSNSATL